MLTCSSKKPFRTFLSFKLGNIYSILDHNYSVMLPLGKADNATNIYLGLITVPFFLTATIHNVWVWVSFFPAGGSLGQFVSSPTIFHCFSLLEL